LRTSWYDMYTRTWGAEKAFQGLQEDGETESEEKDTIHQCSQDFGSVPTVRVTRVRGIF